MFIRNLWQDSNKKCSEALIYRAWRATQKLRYNEVPIFRRDFLLTSIYRERPQQPSVILIYLIIKYNVQLVIILNVDLSSLMNLTNGCLCCMSINHNHRLKYPTVLYSSMLANMSIVFSDIQTFYYIKYIFIWYLLNKTFLNS